MSRKDIFHDTVVNALKKDGWTILSEQVTLRFGDRRFWIDLRARKESSIILIEVKSYYNIDSPIDFLKQALGQYLLYRAILEKTEQDEPLYLAVPEQAYKDIFSEELGTFLIQHYQLNLVVYDVDSEEILQWITTNS